MQFGCKCRGFSFIKAWTLGLQFQVFSFAFVAFSFQFSSLVARVSVALCRLGLH